MCAVACRRIVIVTAVHAPSARYLPEAYESLRAQELPAGWEWHRVIQEDGTTNDFRAPVHPASLFVRRDLLTALGGRTALPAPEDTRVLLALNSVDRGWFSTRAGLLHRTWDGEVTGRAAHVGPVEREARMAVVEARARALESFRWSYPTR
ncbi:MULTISPECIES: hypothetical protein [unclassified Streptomyces]|uniref:hypothetical protein n=1 Tax=unclassified Streptomyces TaxID=2593676 RepID=UPI0033BBC042